MKIYSKLLGKIRKNKARIKKTIVILALGFEIRYGSIKSSHITFSSNSTQQIERVDTFVKEHNQDGKVQEGLSHKSSSRLIKTGSGVLIGNKRISEYSKSAFEDNDQKVILVGRDSSGTPSNVPSNIGQPGQGPSNFPTPPSGGRPTRPSTGVNPYGTYRPTPKVVDQGLGAGANPAGAGGGGPEFEESDDKCFVPKKEQPQNELDHQPSHTQQNKDKNKDKKIEDKDKKKKKKNSRTLSKERLIAEYQNFMQEMSKKGYEVDCDQERFEELSTNSQTGLPDEKALIEAKGVLQGEGQNLFKNARRPKNPEVDLDMEAENINTGETIFIDHKEMIDFESLKEKGIDTSNYPSHQSVAFNMGKDSVKQKEEFIGMDNGPKSKEQVIHLYNFKNIRNRSEVPSLIQAVIDGAEQEGYTNGILFINYEE